MCGLGASKSVRSTGSCRNPEAMRIEMEEMGRDGKDQVGILPIEIPQLPSVVTRTVRLRMLELAPEYFVLGGRSCARRAIHRP